MPVFLEQLSHNIHTFFRTNDEVYRGYSKIKTSLPEDVRIRIQGESLGEFWREREIYYLIDTLNRYPNQKIDLRNNKTVNGIKEFLKKKMQLRFPLVHADLPGLGLFQNFVPIHSEPPYPAI